MRDSFCFLQLNLIQTEILNIYHHFFNIPKETRCLEYCIAKGNLFGFLKKLLKINGYPLLGSFYICTLCFIGIILILSCLFCNNPAMLYYVFLFTDVVDVKRSYITWFWW